MFHNHPGGDEPASWVGGLIQDITVGSLIFIYHKFGVAYLQL